MIMSAMRVIRGAMLLLKVCIMLSLKLMVIRCQNAILDSLCIRCQNAIKVITKF
jgi:hypothetical protein